jgi:hypothetical protein
MQIVAKRVSTGSGRGNSNGTRTVNKSAIMGHFVKESTVTRHPDTTFKQTVKTGGK